MKTQDNVIKINFVNRKTSVVEQKRKIMLENHRVLIQEGLVGHNSTSVLRVRAADNHMAPVLVLPIKKAKKKSVKRKKEDKSLDAFLDGLHGFSYNLDKEFIGVCDFARFCGKQERKVFVFSVTAKNQYWEEITFNLDVLMFGDFRLLLR